MKPDKRDKSYAVVLVLSILTLGSPNWAQGAGPAASCQQAFETLSSAESQFRDLLERGDIIDMQHMAEFQGHLILTFANRVRAIWKPSSPPDVRAEHEIAAYIVDQKLRYGRVPTTVLREINGVRGSLQRIVESYDNVTREDEPDQLALFDELIYNRDRAAKNYLVSGGEIIAIDHAISFLPERAYNYKITHFTDRIKESLSLLKDVRSTVSEKNAARDRIRTLLGPRSSIEQLRLTQPQEWESLLKPYLPMPVIREFLIRRRNILQLADQALAALS